MQSDDLGTRNGGRHRGTKVQAKVLYGAPRCQPGARGQPLHKKRRAIRQSSVQASQLPSAAVGKQMRASPLGKPSMSLALLQSCVMQAGDRCDEGGHAIAGPTSSEGCQSVSSSDLWSNPAVSKQPASRRTGPTGHGRRPYRFWQTDE
jgi:hypothetical protein